MIVEVNKLSHAYQDRVVLHDISFGVEEGRVVGLVGPNAAGKTTLLKALVGQLEPKQGEIKILGRDVRREPEAVRRVLGYLPERANVYDELLVWEYLDMFADIAGLKGAAKRARVDAAMASAALVDRADAPARTLSKGLRQRLAMAAAVMHDPTVVVLDEPTDGLDPESRQLFLDQVRQLATSGKTVFLSSHVLSEIEQVAHVVYILVDGRLVKDQAEDERLVCTVRLRAGSDIARATQIVQAHRDVASVEHEDNALHITMVDARKDAAEILGALIASGFAVVELTPRRETLRRRFARAVGRTVEDLS